MMRHKFIFFSDRKKLADLYEKWRVENNAADVPFNVINFLTINNLIDIDAALDLLEKAKQ